MKARSIIDKALDLVLASILALMSLVIAANVFSRFVLNASIYWGDELAMVLFVWLTFLGAAAGIRDGSHYVFGYFTGRLHGRSKLIYALVGDALTMVGILVLLFYSTRVSIQINEWVMPALEISRSLVYGAAPIGCLLMLYYLIIRLLSYTKQPDL